jgi:hypothetical protein
MTTIPTAWHEGHLLVVFTMAGAMLFALWRGINATFDNIGVMPQ